MLHEISISCTCRNEDPYSGMLQDGEERRRDPNCPRCGGDGYLYRAPQVLIGLAVSIRQQRNILDAGVARPGDMTFSPKPAMGNCLYPDRRITSHDKLTALWSQTVDDGQVIVRGAATLYENKTLKSYLLENEDRLWYEPDAAIWCEDENDKVYRDGTDFILGPGKIIQWVGGQPDIGIRYTLKYKAFFEWVVYDNPQERIDRDNRDLGPIVMLRKRHVAFPNDNPIGTASDKIPLQSRISC